MSLLLTNTDHPDSEEWFVLELPTSRAMLATARPPVIVSQEVRKFYTQDIAFTFMTSQ